MKREKRKRTTIKRNEMKIKCVYYYCYCFIVMIFLFTMNLFSQKQNTQTVYSSSINTIPTQNKKQTNIFLD